MPNLKKKFPDLYSPELMYALKEANKKSADAQIEIDQIATKMRSKISASVDKEYLPLLKERPRHGETLLHWFIVRFLEHNKSRKIRTLGIPALEVKLMYKPKLKMFIDQHFSIPELGMTVSVSKIFGWRGTKEHHLVITTSKIKA